MNEKLLRERINELDNETLLQLYRDCNAWDGSFDFCNVWDIEELAGCMSSNAYELARSIIYGSVTNVMDPVRYNAYGNLETVNEYDLYNDCDCYKDDLIDWLAENSHNIDLDYYIDTDGLDEEDKE